MRHAAVMTIDQERAEDEIPAGVAFSILLGGVERLAGKLETGYSRVVWSGVPFRSVGRTNPVDGSGFAEPAAISAGTFIEDGLRHYRPTSPETPGATTAPKPTRNAPRAKHEDGRLGWSGRSMDIGATVRRLRAVLAYSGDGKLSAKYLTREMGCSAWYVKKALERLIGLGEVKRAGRGRMPGERGVEGPLFKRVRPQEAKCTSNR